MVGKWNDNGTCDRKFLGNGIRFELSVRFISEKILAIWSVKTDMDVGG